jgi:hypothetical protein
MYNGGKIIIGLIIFVGIVTFPILYDHGKVTAKPDPKLDTPEILKMPVSERTGTSGTEMLFTRMKMVNIMR